MDKIDAIITGILYRRENENCVGGDMITKLKNTIIDLRSNENVNNIIYSTWKNSLRERERLFLLENDVKIIESDNSLVPKTGKVNLFKQKINIQKALEHTTSEFIFRGRTEVYVHKELLNYIINNKELRKPIKNGILKSKMWIPWSNINKPWYTADETFFGNIEDIKKMSTIDSSWDDFHVITQGGGSPIRFFILPFMELDIWKKFKKTNGLYCGYPHPPKVAQFNEQYIEYLGNYYAILIKYFHVYNPNQVYFRTVTSPNRTIFHDFIKNFDIPSNIRTIHNWLQIHNDDIIYKLYNGEFNDNISKQIRKVMIETMKKI